MVIFLRIQVYKKKLKKNLHLVAVAVGVLILWVKRNPPGKSVSLSKSPTIRGPSYREYTAFLISNKFL